MDIPLLIKNSYPVQFQFQKFEIDSAKIKSNIKKINIFVNPKSNPHSHNLPSFAFLLPAFFLRVRSYRKAGPTKTPKESFARCPGKLCPYLSLISFTIPNQSQKTSTISLSPLSLNYLFRRSLEA
jgi:hypothetical protein